MSGYKLQNKNSPNETVATLDATGTITLDWTFLGA